MDAIDGYRWLARARGDALSIGARRYQHPLPVRRVPTRPAGVLTGILLGWLLATWLLCPLSFALAQSPPAAPRVLVLSAYHAEFEWSADVVTAIEETLHAVDPSIRVAVEHMDTKRHAPEDVASQLAALYGIKYRDRAFDAILCVDNNALDFALGHREALFGSAPIVFCGINGYSPALIEGHADITGVAENVNMADTLRLIGRLHPNVRQVAVISDVTPTSRLNLRHVREVAEVQGVDLVELDELTVDGLRDAIAALPDDTAILYLDLYRTPSDETLTLDQGLALAMSRPELPVYSLWEDKIRAGVVGGVITTAEAQGQRAAELAWRVLQGEDADDIPVIVSSPWETVLNYDQLQRHGIEIGQLPPGATVRGRPERIIDRYREYVWGAGATLVALLAVIVVLALNVRARRRAEERYAAVLSTTSDAVVSADAAGRVTLVNPGAVKLLGYDGDAVIGKPLAMLCPEDLRERQEVVRRRALDGESQPPSEAAALAADGRRVPVEISVSPSVDAAGRTIGTTSILRDITERLEAQAALRESEAQFRTLAEESPNMIWINQGGRVVYANPRCSEVLGYSRQELTDPAFGFCSLIAPEARERVQQRFIEFQQGSTESFDAYQLIARDGTRLEVTEASRLIQYRGAPAILGTVTDVTAAKRAERALRESEERFRTVIEGLPAGVFAHDLDGHFVLVNEAACRLTGYSRDELLGMSVADIDPASVTRADRERLWLALREGESRTLQVTHRRKNGTRYPASLHMNAIALGGRPIMLGFAIDMTEQRQAEASLREREERLDILFQQAADAMFVCTMDGRLVEVNQAACDGTGYSREELLAMRASDISERYNDPDALVAFLETLAPGHPVVLDTDHRRRDGTTYPVEIVLAALETPQGRQVLGVARNVTESRRQAQLQAAHLHLVEYAADHGIEDLIQETLDEAERLTDSRIGFYVFIDEALGQVSQQTWSRHTVETYCAVPLGAHDYAIADAGVWTDAVHQRGPIIHNDYTRLPHKKGLPSGHAPLVRELVVPVMRGDQIVACVGVGNKPSDYGPDDIETVQRLATVAWETVMRRQAELDREAALEALRESEERFRRVLEGLASGVFAHDLDGHLVLVNEAACRNTGWSREELLTMRVRDIDPESITRQDREQLWRSLHETGTRVVASTHLRKDGSQYPVEIYLTAIVLGGEPIVLGMASDISERRRAEQALVEGEAFLRQIIDTSPSCVFVKDWEGRYVMVNRTIADLYDTTREAMEGKTDQQLAGMALLGPEEAAAFLADDREVITTGRPKTVAEEPFTRSDGSLRWFQTTKVPLRTASGATHVLGVAVDITARKNAELALLEATQREAELVRAANIGLWDWDLQTNTVRYSDEWKRQLGYEPGEISDAFDEFLSRLHPEDVDRIMAESGLCIAGKQQAYETSFRLRHKDGSFRSILAQASLVMDDRGQPVRMRGSHIDITERERAREEREHLQAQLSQARRMEAVGRLAGGVAHDFNNMLAVIMGRSEMALDLTPESDPLHEELIEIQKAAERSAGLTRQLLAFARRQTVVPVVLNLNDTLSGMLKMLQRLIGENIALTWSPASNLWPVKIDPSQVDQILANLCVNARDAIDGVGQVTIETHNTVIDETYCGDHPECVPGDYVQLVVTDDGHGMDDEMLDHLFEPFYTTKEIGQGTGLGLATVYGIVKQNEGFVNVYSELGVGSVFRIYLPRHRAKAQQMTVEQAEEAPRGQETILLVEDEAAILGLGKAMLTRMGYHVLAAASPMEAIAIAETYRGSIHLLMTDVIMPEMNGRDLAQRVLTIYPEIKRLFMSGYTADVIAHHGVLDPGVAFLPKPYTRDQLARKVREALEGD